MTELYKITFSPLAKGRTDDQSQANGNNPKTTVELGDRVYSFVENGDGEITADAFRAYSAASALARVRPGRRIIYSIDENHIETIKTERFD